MPLPFILIGAAIAAGAAGIGSGAHGFKKISKAKKTVKSAQERHEENVARLEAQKQSTVSDINTLKELELKILKSFDGFSDVLQKIQNRPEFKSYHKDDVHIPDGDVVNFSTDTRKIDIVTAVLTPASAGMGLLLGGIIFNIVGSSVSQKADKTVEEVNREEAAINEICAYMKELSDTANKYSQALTQTDDIYCHYLQRLECIVLLDNKTDYNSFNFQEKQILENCSLLVGLLYNMCKVQLVLQPSEGEKLGAVNVKGIEESITNSQKKLNSLS